MSKTERWHEKPGRKPRRKAQHVWSPERWEGCDPADGKWGDYEPDWWEDIEALDEEDAAEA
jgi:hypothetical protein